MPTADLLIPDTINKFPAERLRDLTDKPERTMKLICVHVGNGGTAVTLSDNLGVRHADLMWWVNCDDKRARQYKEAVRAREEWTEESVINELRMLALCDLGDAFNEDHTLKPISEWPQAVKKSIKSIQVEEIWKGKAGSKEHVGFTKKVTFWDKTKAIELIGKSLNLFIDKLEVKGKVTLEDLIMNAGGKDESTS